MTTRQLRLLRAATAAAVATILAATSHTVAGGAAPHPLLVLAMAVLLIPLTALLIGIRLSRVRVGLAVLAAQTAFHAVFQMLGGPASGPIPGPSSHQHHLDLAAFGPTTTLAAPDALMIAAHVVAALATTALLWHGESLIRAIARWVLARLRRDVTTVGPPSRRPLRPASSPSVRPHPFLTASLSRRGPPLPA